MSYKKCETCKNWVMRNIGTEREFPYCFELQYWLPCAEGPVHTPSDFGCIKHSAVLGTRWHEAGNREAKREVMTPRPLGEDD